MTIAATSITITRAEGPTHLCGRPRTFTGPTCWKDARAWLRAWAGSFPVTGGYDKHDFVVTFADGETYEGRLDCKAWSCSDPDLDVAAHIRSFLSFMAGLRCPPHLKREDYELFIDRHAEDVPKFLAFLETYELPEC